MASRFGPEDRALVLECLGVTPADREQLAQARAVVAASPEGGVERYVLGFTLVDAGLREEGRDELLRAVQLMAPREAELFGWQAVEVLRESGFREAAEAAAQVVRAKVRRGKHFK